MRNAFSITTQGTHTYYAKQTNKTNSCYYPCLDSDIFLLKYVSFKYMTVIQHLYTLQSGHDKFSNHLSLHEVMILLTVFPGLCMTSPRLTYFIMGSLCLSFPSAFFIHPPRHPLSLSFVCLYVFFNSTYK